MSITFATLTWASAVCSPCVFEARHSYKPEFSYVALVIVSLEPVTKPLPSLMLVCDMLPRKLASMKWNIFRTATQNVYHYEFILQSHLPSSFTFIKMNSGSNYDRFRLGSFFLHAFIYFHILFPTDNNIHFHIYTTFHDCTLLVYVC